MKVELFRNKIKAMGRGGFSVFLGIKCPSSKHYAVINICICFMSCHAKNHRSDHSHGTLDVAG